MSDDDGFPQTHAEFMAKACDRCGKNARMLDDMNVMMLTAQSPGMTGHVRHIICGPCSILWQEWVAPSLMTDASYVAMRDQIMADYRELGGA